MYYRVIGVVLTLDHDLFFIFHGPMTMIGKDQNIRHDTIL